MNPAKQQTRKTVTLIVTTLTAFLAPFMGSATNIALPAIAKEFEIDAVLLGWVATSYLLAAAIFLIPIGKIADIYGRKKVFMVGVAVYTVASLFSAFPPSVALLIGFRCAQGFGAAMIFGTSISILSSVFPPQERGKVIGINVASTYLGLSLGPVLGGMLTEHFGWRSVFWVNALPGPLIFAGVLWKLKGDWAEAKGERLDWLGSLLSGTTLATLIIGVSRLPETLGILLLLTSGFAFAAFIWWELQVEYPVLNLNLFRQNNVFAFSNLAALINYSATAGIGFLLSLYLQHIKGLSPQQAGMILIAQPVMMAIFSPLAGRLSDRIEPRTLSSSGMAIICLGLCILTQLHSETTTLFLVTTLMFLGVGFALFSSPNTAAVMGSVDKRFYSIASATLAAMRTTGQMLSMGIIMVIFTLHIGRVQITPEYHAQFLTSVKIAFLVFAALCFGGIFASLARGKRM